MTHLMTAKPSQKQGMVEIDKERCKGCGLCVASCPKAVLSMSSQFNSKGYSPAEARQPDKCTGCGMCALMCPDVAISVYRRRQEKERMKQDEVSG